MAKHPPTKTGEHDYLPAGGKDSMLPFYDLLSLVTGAAGVHQRLVDQARLVAGQRVLEIGCGTGNLCLRAKRTEPGIDLIGSDPDPLALARAQRKARGLTGITFERGYSQHLPYADGSFDRVLSSLMLHHLDHDTKVATATEVARILRPGGSLHVADFDGDLHGMHGALAKRMSKMGHLSDNKGNGLLEIFTAAGLDCVKVTTHRRPLMGEVVFYRCTRPKG